MNPEVTCLQTSYGRPDVSREAVECYLRNIEKKAKLDLRRPWVPAWNHDYEAKAKELFEKLGKFL